MKLFASLDPYTYNQAKEYLDEICDYIERGAQHFLNQESEKQMVS